MKSVNQEPIVYGDILQLVTWLVNLAIAANYLSSEEGSILIPIVTTGIVILFNLGILILKRNNVTPWNKDNPLVNYQDDN